MDVIPKQIWKVHMCGFAVFENKMRSLINAHN